jgi:hypothetical protein
MKFLILLATVFVVATGIQELHGPQSTSREIAHLSSSLHLTGTQRDEIVPILNKHHDRIQSLLDRNPTLSLTDLQPQVHAISDDTHRAIDALLTSTQLQHAQQLERH